MLTRKRLYAGYAASNHSFWDRFEKKHRAAFWALALAYRAYKWSKRLRYHFIYRRFKTFTMASRRSYLDNLMLSDQFRHVAGAVVECGVWKGGIIAGLATLLGPDREYYLFDSFEGLPPAGEFDGQRAHARMQPDYVSPKGHGKLEVDVQIAEEAMRRTGVQKYQIVKGWFRDTLPPYAGPAIAILRIDGDWYESTMDALIHLYPHVTPGGLIIVDDYYHWEGCARAVHDFLSREGIADPIKEFRNQICYLVKRQEMSIH